MRIMSLQLSLYDRIDLLEVLLRQRSLQSLGRERVELVSEVRDDSFEKGLEEGVEFGCVEEVEFIDG